MRNSGLMYLNASIRETNRFFADVKDLVLFLCARAENTDREQPCDQLGQQADIIAVFSLAASARAAAQTSAQYEEVARIYARALGFLESYREFPDRNRLRAFAHEGVAYARYRQHNLPAATAAIREAHRFNPSFLLIGLTETKILCAQQIDPQRVRAKLNELRIAPFPGAGPDGGEERARVVDQTYYASCAYALECASAATPLRPTPRSRPLEACAPFYSLRRYSPPRRRHFPPSQHFPPPRRAGLRRRPPHWPPASRRRRSGASSA